MLHTDLQEDLESNGKWRETPMELRVYYYGRNNISTKSFLVNSAIMFLAFHMTLGYRTMKWHIPNYKVSLLILLFILWMVEVILLVLFLPAHPIVCQSSSIQVVGVAWLVFAAIVELPKFEWINKGTQESISCTWSAKMSIIYQNVTMKSNASLSCYP